MEELKKVKLNLASGVYYIDGYINIDNNAQGDFKVDHKADVFTLEWEKESVDEILLNHFMMYISLEDAPTLIRRWFSWLKKGGKLIIETGNVKTIALKIAGTSDPDVINGNDCLMQLFGWKLTSGHKWAWCPDTLMPLLSEAGFSTLDIGEGVFHGNPTRDFMIVATK